MAFIQPGPVNSPTPRVEGPARVYSPASGGSIQTSGTRGGAVRPLKLKRFGVRPPPAAKPPPKAKPSKSAKPAKQPDRLPSEIPALVTTAVDTALRGFGFDPLFAPGRAQDGGPFPGFPGSSAPTPPSRGQPETKSFDPAIPLVAGGALLLLYALA